MRGPTSDIQLKRSFNVMPPERKNRSQAESMLRFVTRTAWFRRLCRLPIFFRMGRFGSFERSPDVLRLPSGEIIPSRTSHAISRQYLCNQTRIPGGTVELELQSSLISVSRVAFSASSDFQPCRENSIIDPSSFFM